jgi:hypothetical protein
MKAAGVFPPQERECLYTLLHSSTSQKAVVFIVTSLSNLVLVGVEVPGTSVNNCTDQEKISAKNATKANVHQFMANGKPLLASTVLGFVASTSSITLA